jgi:hypothetical protein
MHYFKARVATKIGHKHSFFIVNEKNEVFDYQVIYPGYLNFAISEIHKKYPNIKKHEDYMRIISTEQYWIIFSNIMKLRLRLRRSSYDKKETR